MGIKNGLLFKRVNSTRIIPVRLKIIIVFIIFVVLSNFITNYINLIYNRSHQIKLMKELLAKDLKDILAFTATQHEIFSYTNDKENAFVNIKNKAMYELKSSKAIFIAFDKKGAIIINASKTPNNWMEIGGPVIEKINKDFTENMDHGFLTLNLGGQEYFGIYKYSSKWDMFLFRAEEYKEFTEESWVIFKRVSSIIGLISVMSTIVGIFVIGYMLRYIGVISNGIMEMVKTQQLSLIDLSKAPNDDITYMGMAFNSLSSTIDTLLNIFKKFTNQDIAYQAYREKDIRLEGSQKELAILFSDIKGFTNITETLGTDIIKLINMHYDRAIREIVKYDGTIGSIIGDALLAMFGTMSDYSKKNKSLSAVYAAYEIHKVAYNLREEMTRKKDDYVDKKGALTPAEEKVYKAVLIEVGVGIDGGEVFYGNIGSYVRMTNTVIGDNVNASSRLEGLTRIYKVPVICSEYIKNDIEQNTNNSEIVFVELDMVQVKGKTEGKKIFWPILKSDYNGELRRELKIYEGALKNYYSGNWTKAFPEFSKCKLPMAEVFKERTAAKKAPKNWRGIWAMTSK